MKAGTMLLCIVSTRFKIANFANYLTTLFYIFTMRKTFLFFLIIAIVIPAVSSAQEKRAKVAVVSVIDTMLTHVYGNRWYSSAYEKDIYNYGKETIKGLTSILGDANLEVVEVDMPSWINKMSLFNVLGKPSKPMEKWFEILKIDLDADFLVMVVKKFEPENKISHRFLNGKQYGIATYTKYPDAINIFSFVGYYIFDIDNSDEIRININHDQYLLMDLRLDNRMSNRELKDLPQKYLDLTRDKMTQIVNTRNVEIKRSLLEYLNQ